MHEDLIKKAGDIVESSVRGVGYCALALIDLDGSPAASTITASKADGIIWITFCTGKDGPKAERIAKCGRAGVCFSAPDYNISLVGSIDILTDPDIKREMWYDGLQHHFTGPDDPNYCVLRFKTERYNLLVDWKEARGVL
jgi:general stress protein 26